MIQDFEKFLNNLKNNERYNDFCVNDALSHQNSIKEALDAREKNPRDFYNESMDQGKFLYKALPILYMWWEAGALRNAPPIHSQQVEN